jgi:hypothetical protein
MLPRTVSGGLPLLLLHCRGNDNFIVTEKRGTLEDVRSLA